MAVFVTSKDASRTDPAWQDLDEINGAANKGVRLAADITDEKAQVLFVDIEPDGFIAMHSQPERSVCYIAEGEGTILIEGQPDITYASGDTITFAPNVSHGWRNKSTRTRLLVVVLA
jgi:quercetin dioxygenase-like cupin family protein